MTRKLRLFFLFSSVILYYDTMARRQGTYWLGTISCEQSWEPILPASVAYLRGQRERGSGGFEHFQIFFITSVKQSIRGCGLIFAPVVGHWELTRSAAAESYVWKQDTRVGEPFEFGQRPFRRNVQHDWDAVKLAAQENRLGDIPSDLFVRYYRSLTAIASDFAVPVSIERSIVCYWGLTGTGKSRRAWSEGGDGAYAKDPMSKFWCGYSGQTVVIIDEFRGAINISHVLRWFDRYPVSVEIKGGSRPLLAERIYVTSNIHPNRWYPDLDTETLDALLRRMEVINII